MALRFWLGVLTSGFSDQRNESDSSDTPETVGLKFLNVDYESPAKLHIGMLSISFIVGLAFGGFVSYVCWETKDTFIAYIRNLVMALTCRTFFSLLFDAVVLLGSLSNVQGGNTLLAFEQICMGLVLAFWLTLTIYSHARVQRDFNSEPTLLLYQYGVPGVAVFFAFVWIFTLQDQFPDSLWWIVEGRQPLSKWIVNSAYLLFILIQLGLAVDMAKTMWAKKSSLDNDSISLLRKIGAMFGTLIFYFWLQLGLTFGRMPLRNPAPYVNFYCIVDGLECAIVCPCLYFYNKWVPKLLKNMPSPGNEGSSQPIDDEVLLAGARGIVTIDSVFMTSESGRLKPSREEETNNVVYSNVVPPERLEKTLELYKRFNVIPKQQVTVFDGEEFYDCRFSSVLQHETDDKKLSQQIRSVERISTEENKTTEQTQKKSAFYSSKYLILDPKEGDFPKYLETRPSVSSVSGKDSPKQEREVFVSEKNTFEAEERVRRWLHDNSNNIPKPDESESAIHRQEVEEVPEYKKPGPDAEKVTVPEPSVFFDLKEAEDDNLVRGKNALPITKPEETLKQTDEANKEDSTNQEGRISATSMDSATDAKTDFTTTETPKDTKTSAPGNESDEPDSGQPNEVSIQASAQKQTENAASLQKKSEYPTACPNSYLTYSELEEFRSKRGEGSPQKYPSADEQSSSFSENIFAAIGSLLGAGGNLYDSIKKFSYSGAQATLPNHYPMRDSEIEQPKVKLSTEEERFIDDVSPEETYSEAKNKQTEPQSASALTPVNQPIKNEVTAKGPGQEMSGSPEERKITPVILGNLEQQSRVESIGKTSDSHKTDRRKSYDHEESDQSSLEEPEESIYEPPKNVRTVEEPKKGDNILWPMSNLGEVKTQARLRPKQHKQKRKLTPIMPGYFEQQSRVEPIRTSSISHKTDKRESLGVDKPKSDRGSLEESEESIYDYPKVRTNYSVPVEYSSESEFSIENRRDSSESFSLEKYYINLIEVTDKFQNRQNVHN